MCTKLRRILIPLVIKKLQIHNTAFCSIQIRIKPVNNTVYCRVSGNLRRGNHIFRGHNLQRLNVSFLNFPGFFIYAPTHYIVTGTGHNQIARAVNVERTVSGKEIFLSVVYNEERTSVNHNIKRVVGTLRRSLAGNRSFNGTGFGTKTNLPRVDAAHSCGCVCAGSRPCRLIHQITEYHGL